VTGLNPIVSIAALLIGLKVGGLVGAILAIPVATLVVVILEDLFNEMK
jgi:predicted PurR-regulated permease PerM